MVDAALAASVPHARRDLRALLAKRGSELEKLMREGTAPSYDELVGWEFAGTNLGAMTDLLGIRKFKKGFYRGDPRVPHRAIHGTSDFIQGYNVVVKQNGIPNPHVAHPDERAPKRHGFYRVQPVASGAKDAKYPNALILHYGLGRNGGNPAAFLRDYLVQPFADDPDLLLGKAYLALGGLRIAAGYFVLVRHNKHDFAGQ